MWRTDILLISSILYLPLLQAIFRGSSLHFCFDLFSANIAMLFPSVKRPEYEILSRHKMDQRAFVDCTCAKDSLVSSFFSFAVCNCCLGIYQSTTKTWSTFEGKTRRYAKVSLAKTSLSRSPMSW